MRKGTIQQLFSEVMLMEGNLRRSEALALLKPHFETLPRDKLYQLWVEVWQSRVERTRSDLLWDIQAFAPVVSILGGERAVMETLRAIQDVCRWWP